MKNRGEFWVISSGSEAEGFRILIGQRSTVSLSLFVLLADTCAREH